MTDSTPDTQDEETLDHKEIPEDDWLLEELVQLANSVDDFSIGITLTVSGAVVTGTLIGMRQYFREYGKLWSQVLGGGEIGKRVEERWIKEGNDSMEERPAESVPRFNYVHVKDARVVAGTSMAPTAGGLLWRGRLAEVSGFAIGALGVLEQHPTAT